MDATPSHSAHTEDDAKMGYSKPSSSFPSSLKFKCMATGEKRHDPCSGCNNTNNCIANNLQIKEPTVDNINEKSVVKIDSDGNVSACPKGDVSQCGYKPGAKVCGKCGAMATEVKFVPGASSETDEEAMEFAKFKEAPASTETNETDLEEKGAYNNGMSHVDDPMDEDFRARRKQRHKKRMASMGGIKDASGEELVFEEDQDYFLCASTREIKTLAGNSPCGDCAGRCVSNTASPDLLEIEAMAEDIIGGKTLFSAYGDEFDLFAVQVRRKDGQPVEVYFTADGDLDGWLRIPEAAVYTETTEIVDLPTAVEAALSTIEGKALSIAVGRFEDQEAYLVDVEGVDGKSYEVAVSPGGSVIGFGERIEEKRMFSPEERESLAEEGQALPDGSYPIEDADDLKNAIQAFGRAKDKEKAKAHIMKRAQDLGLEDMIPENWKSEEKSVVTADVATMDIAATLAELELLAMEEEISDLLGDN